MKKLYSSAILILTLFYCHHARAQFINHWETAVDGHGLWKYTIPLSQPVSTWNTLSFNDSGWNSGYGSIGYGDGDDSTLTLNVYSVYMRKQFTIADTSKILGAILNADYDDAFVAYLNGVEIARANIGTPGIAPVYNQTAATFHEAQLYQGNMPSYYVLDKQAIAALLVPGNNILSAEVHNESIFSSDLTSLFYLNVAISDSSFSYDSLPPWFSPPLISSDLPIISINTNGQQIVDDPRIVAEMGIIYNGPGIRNNITDSFNNYNGLINIEIRGSSSQSFPKKSFSLETQDTADNAIDVSLLGQPSENDWVLYAPYDDKTLMRDQLMYRIGRDMGRYASRTVYAELLINGEYEGIYVLEEKIKRDANRVHIAKLTPADTVGDDLTGGYILKIDKGTAGGLYWSSSYPPYPGAWQTIDFRYHDPDGVDLMPQQIAYIQNYMYEAETSLADSNFTDPDSGYRKYIDPASFIDFFIANEVSRNVDGYRLSTYFYKDKDSNGGKLKMGPLWDFNIALGNANYCQGGYSTGWAWQFNTFCSGDSWQVPFWWDRLLQDSLFANDLQCRWQYLRQNVLSTSYIFNFIDSVALLVNESQQRNFQRWPILGVYIWPNNIVFNTYAEEVNYLKTWLTDRLNWMDANIPGTCSSLGTNTLIAESPGLYIYPNPMTNSATIYFTTAKIGNVSITISDITGRMIKTIFNGSVLKGSHTLHWNNENDLKAGMYLLHLDAGNYSETKKLSIGR